MGLFGGNKKKQEQNTSPQGLPPGMQGGLGPQAPPKQENKGQNFSLFKGKQPDPGQGMQASEDALEAVRRVRVLEERLRTLSSKAQITEENLISSRKHTMRELKLFDEDLREIKRDIAEVKSTVRKLVGELRNLAPKEEVTVLKRYIELWQPANFVTRNEVERIIEDKLGNTIENQK